MTHPAAMLTAARRARELDMLASGEVVDLLVIGGGVTGTGVALDAASRGLSVALVERRDLAYGTSRWSSKLVHGGLRYLAHGRVGLAAQSARERGILLEHTAPHLARPRPFLIPYTVDVPPARAASVHAAAWIGDLLRAGTGTRRQTLPRPRRVGAEEARRHAPALRADGLRGALLNWDGQLVDDARLVVALARTAAGHGARILTYCTAERVTGTAAVVTDELGGTTVELRARHVVNATGVWAGTLDPAVRLRPSRGAHLVVPAARLGNPTAGAMVPVPGTRNRWVFALAAGDGLVYVGLTDDPLEGALPDVPEATAEDVRFLLATINRALAVPLDDADVVGAFAGLRPLLAGADGPTADLSRQHRLLERDDGLLTLVGGKLTTYRRMAEDAVDAVAARPGVAAGPCRTHRLPLVGAAPRHRLRGVAAPGRLVERYGTEAPTVAALSSADPDLARSVAPGSPVTGAELAFGVTHEGALTVEDLLERRTRLGLVAADADAARPLAEALLAGSPAR